MSDKKNPDHKATLDYHTDMLDMMRRKLGYPVNCNDLVQHNSTKPAALAEMYVAFCNLEMAKLEHGVAEL